MKQHIYKVLYSEEEIASIVKKLGASISADYADKNLLLVTLLKGSLLFTADLIRQITVPCRLECMAVSSYQGNTQTTGTVTILQDIALPLDDVDVLVVEDILDTGLTLQYILKHIKSKHAKSVKICTLFNKPEGRKVHITAEYIAATVPNEILVVYVLAYNEYYRNLPFVGILSSAVIARDCQQNSSQSKE